MGSFTFGSRLVKSAALAALPGQLGRNVFDGRSFAFGTALYAALTAVGTLLVMWHGVRSALWVLVVAVPLLCAVSLIARFPRPGGVPAGAAGSSIVSAVRRECRDRSTLLALAGSALSWMSLALYVALVGQLLHRHGLDTGAWPSVTALLSALSIPFAWFWTKLVADRLARRLALGLGPAAAGWCVLGALELMPDGLPTGLRGALWLVGSAGLGIAAGTAPRAAREVLFRRPDSGMRLALEGLASYSAGAAAALVAGFALVAVGLVPIAIVALIAAGGAAIALHRAG
jgi:hypothetical protein